MFGIMKAYALWAAPAFVYSRSIRTLDVGTPHLQSSEGPGMFLPGYPVFHKVME